MFPLGKNKMKNLTYSMIIVQVNLPWILFLALYIYVGIIK